MTISSLEDRTEADPIAQLCSIASEIGAVEIADDARALASRIAEGLFYVACVGQFKRGKSTLLNAFVGQPLLPTGVIPVTAVITIVRYGPTVRALVHFADGREEAIATDALSEYIAEEKNPENRKRVNVVEVFAPADLLSSGMCLVDTPGLGSVFRQNTETTRAFFPHIDAALMVVGADPPISGEEVAVAEEIGREIRQMIFALNKADRMSEAEVAEAAEFTRRTLTQRLQRDVRLFSVSALEVVQRSETRDWPALKSVLSTLAHEAGADLVRTARERGQRRLTERLLREVKLQRETLMRPIAVSEARVSELKTTIDDARQALGDLGFLFTAEQHRLSREFEEERSHFLGETLSRAEAELDGAIARSTRTGGGLRDEVFHAAESIASRVVREWLERIEPRAEELYGASMDRFVTLAQNFLDRVEAADITVGAEDILTEQRFRKRRGFFFTGLWMLTGRPPGAFVVDYFRTAARQRDRARRDAHAYIRRLFESNSARVANDLRERVLESRRVLEADIRLLLDRAAASAERALDRARKSQAAGASAVEAEIARLDTAIARLRSLSAS